MAKEKKNKKEIMEEIPSEEEEEEEVPQEDEEEEEAEVKAPSRERSERPRSFGDREMFAAKCADCGNNTEVPFKPDPNRPVYCRDCFMKRRPKFSSGGRGRDRY